ncbi:SPFH domain-containing protein, partial [bacterium]|nr:SPFH domain-containing protein [bacterium]
LKEILSDRDKIAENLKNQIDVGASTYGIDVRAVRITDIDTPPTLIEELAVIARARRSAEAKRIEANAEVEVANKTAEASEILRQSVGAMQLRELQVLSDISKEESSMVIVYPYGDRSGEEIAHSLSGRAYIAPTKPPKA